MKRSKKTVDGVLLRYGEIKCKECSTVITTNITDNIESVLCGFCVANAQIKLFGMPKGTEIIATDDSIPNIVKPRGWHFMSEYVDSEGNVYCKGKLVEANTDKAETIVEDKPVKTKKKKNKKNQFSIKSLEASKKIQKLKKEIKNDDNLTSAEIKSMNKKIKQLSEEV